MFKATALLLSLVVLTLSISACSTANAFTGSIPDPKVDAQLTQQKGTQTAVLAGGCFWGIEAVFEHVKGVSKAESGYSGGSQDTAEYQTVSSGRSGHAESVKVTYDPSQVTYGQLLKVFFAVAHDPTELNRQGPDIGSQYRSAIFFANDEQKRIAESYIAQLSEAKVFSDKIVTQVVPLKAFYEAEDYHQDFLENNPTYPYIVQHDMPKLANLKKLLPELYKGK